MNGTDPTLIVFARTPVPGAVKTRFTPPCTPAQAAALASAMIRHTVRLAARHWPGPLRVAVWPGVDHPVFADLRREIGVPIDQQSAGDLGDKMRNAIAAQNASGAPAAVLGTDVPHCPAATLERAYRLLRDGEDVLGPTDDGGYYLIGLQHPIPALFRDITWGSDQVCAVTQSRATALGVVFHRLDTLVDIDTWADLTRVADAFAPADQWRRQLEGNAPVH